MLAMLIISGGCLALYGAFVLISTWYFIRSKVPTGNSSTYPSLSIVIPARNESLDIEACLKAVLSQEYPGEFEVIFVDDQSTDDTLEKVQKGFGQDKRLRILSTEIPGKKAAISKAVSRAKGEVILQTDADCRMGKYWALAMTRSFGREIDFVSGPIALDYSGNFFESMQALETMGLVIFGAGFLLAGKPNMVNGANMAYRKSVFQELKGFEGIDHVASGDDELLLQKITQAGSYKLDFCKDAQAMVKTDALSSWKAFRAQRIRWVSKSRAYINRTPNLIQAISYVGFLFFPLLLIASFVDPSYLWICLWAFLIKLLIDIIIMYQAARFFHNLRLLYWFLPLQILYIPYVLWIGIAGTFVKRYSWKGRKVS